MALIDWLSSLALISAILLAIAAIVYLPYWTIIRLLKVSNRIYVKRSCKRHTFQKSRRAYHFERHTAPPPKPTPYDILRCKPDDDNETIKKCYRTLVKQYHPDHLANIEGNEKNLIEAKIKMQQINDAYRAIKKLRGLKK